MKKQRSYFILALLCASTAHAGIYVTPTRDQRVDSVMRRDPEMFETCKFHTELISTRQAKIDNVKNEGCKKVVSLFFDAVQKGWDACSDSYDMNVRNFISKSMDTALKAQGFYCTPAQALLAPCPACDKSFIDIKRVTETFSTTEVKESMGAYSSLLPKLTEAANQNSCPEFASHVDDYKGYLSRLAGELSRSKVSAVRFTRENVQGKEIKTSVRLGEEQNVGSYHQEFSPIQAGSDEVGSGPQSSFAGGGYSSANSVAQSSNGSASSSHSVNSQARRPAQAQNVTPSENNRVEAARPFQSNAQGSNNLPAQSGEGRTNFSTAGTQASTPALEPTFNLNSNLEHFLATHPMNASGTNGSSRNSNSNRTGTAAGDSVDNGTVNTAGIVSNTGSTVTGPSKPALPEGLEVAGRMSDGRVGFAYTDPKDPNKNYVGYQVRDPKTNKLKTYAYVTSRANAEAVKKNPTLCDQYIKDARTHAPKANADSSALGRGNELFSPKNSSKPSTDMAQAASAQTEDQAQPQTQAGAGTGAVVGSDSNGSNNSSNNSSNSSSGDPANQSAAATAATGSSDAKSDSQFHIGSSNSAATGLKPNARTGLNPDARVGVKTGETQGSSSAASSGETPRSSVEAQAAAQKIAQQNLSIASPTDSSNGRGPASNGSGTGLKDQPNVTLGNGSSGTGIKSQIKPNPDLDKDHDGASASTAESDASKNDTLKIGKPDSSTTGASSNTSQGSVGTVQSGSLSQAGSHTPSQSKPKPAAKKRRPKTPSTQKSHPKPTEAQKQRVSEYTTLAATSKGFGTVRYFLLNKFPNPEIGRWEIVNGKTEEIRYNMPADSSVIKDLTAHPEKLESTFINARYQFKQVKPHFLDPDVSDALQGIWQKQP